MKTMRRILVSSVLGAFLFGAIALMTPAEAWAKGKPPKGPKCDNCPPTIEIGGIVCTLDDCGFDCVYSCPFPG